MLAAQDIQYEHNIVPDALLNEVFNGNYDNFRNYLENKKVWFLDLQSKNFTNQPLAHLGKALQGTHVTAICFGLDQVNDEGAKDLAAELKGTHVTRISFDSNQISDKGVKDFVMGLKGAQVNEVYISGEKITNQGAKDVAACIPDTSLVVVSLGVYPFEFINGSILNPLSLTNALINIVSGCHKWKYVLSDVLMDAVLGTTRQQELDKAVKLNYQKLVLSPYYMTALRLLPAEEKKKHINLGVEKLDTQEGRLRFAGGILMSLEPNLFHKCLSHLPIMSSRKTKNYLNIAKKCHPEGLKVKEEKIDQNQHSLLKLF